MQVLMVLRTGGMSYQQIIWNQVMQDDFDAPVDFVSGPPP